MSAAGTDRSCSAVVPSSRRNRPVSASACAASLTWSPPLDSAARAIRPRGERRRQQVGHRLAARGQAVDGDLVRVAAEGGDVLPGPAQRRDLVVQTRGAGRALAGHVEEAERAEPVVDRDDHERRDCARTRRRRRPACGPSPVSYPPPCSQNSTGRPLAPAGAVTFRYRQSSADRRRLRVRRPQLSLQRAVPVLERVAHAAPRFRRLRRPEPKGADRRSRVRDAPPGEDAVGDLRAAHLAVPASPRRSSGSRSSHRPFTFGAYDQRRIFHELRRARTHVHDHVTGRCDRGTVRLRGGGRLPGRAGHRRGAPAAGRRRWPRRPARRPPSSRRRCCTTSATCAAPTPGRTASS